MPHHEFNVLADEILFFEAPVGYHIIWKNNNKIVIEVITLATFKNRPGPKTYLLKYKESYIVVTS